MANKVKSKGTKLQATVSSTLTDIPGVISITLPAMETQTYNANTLDAAAGIPYELTGQTEGGSWGAEIFYDPADTTQAALTTILTTPATNAMKIIFTNTEASEWAFTTVGCSFGGSVAIGDGVKATIGGKITGIPTFTV